MALTLVECLCGHPPIEGDMHAMMGSALDIQRRPTPRNEGVDISDEVEAVFDKAMRVDPRERYVDVQAFWTALQLAARLPSSFASIPEPTLELANRAKGGSSFDQKSMNRPLAQQEAGPSPSIPKVAGGANRVTFDLDVEVDARPSNSTGLAKPPSSDEPTPSAARLRGPISRREAQTLSGHLRLPLQLFAVGVGCTILNALATRFTGSGIALGPIRLHWIAAVFAGAAVLVAFLNFIRDDS
jgi:serine/threonine-protein kinase